jgi:hypothetical protein
MNHVPGIVLELYVPVGEGVWNVPETNPLGCQCPSTVALVIVGILMVGHQGTRRH